MKKLFSTSLLILAGMLLLLGSCKEDELPVSGEGNVANNELPVRLAETDYNPNNTYYLLNDNESQDVYFDSGQRSFYVSRPLQFGMDDEHCFQLRFYSPRALKNVTFWARIDGYEEEFKFMSLEKIMPFQQLRVHIPFANKDLTAYTRSGKKIRIMANPYLTEENLTFTVECDDPYWTRLQSIRCKWYIAFGRYSDTQDSWKYKMKASHTREAVAIALNMAYMFSSERFKTALYEFGPLHSNNDKAEIDKTALLANVLNHRGLTFGYTTGVMGLGGGTTFGMHEVCYLEHYADDKSITETIFHEFAHCVGYGHAGNMTYEQTGPGWITLCNNVYVALSLDKELPVYSRRFLHTRWSRNRYFDDIYVASKHIIEDPELDALDGGLSPLRGETDRGGNDGEPVAFKLDYTDLPGATGTTFRPKDVYVYGLRGPCSPASIAYAGKELMALRIKNLGTASFVGDINLVVGTGDTVRAAAEFPGNFSVLPFLDASQVLLAAAGKAEHLYADRTCLRCAALQRAGHDTRQTLRQLCRRAGYTVRSDSADLCTFRTSGRDKRHLRHGGGRTDRPALLHPSRQTHRPVRP